MEKRPAHSPARGRHAILGQEAFAAISAVEGLQLTPQGRKRVHSNAPVEQRRADVIRAYMEIKGLK